MFRFFKHCVPMGFFVSASVAAAATTSYTFVDLHPVGPVNSQGNTIVVGQQAGYVDVPIGGFAHAAIWAGTADSFVDLNPDGFLISNAHATDGSHQAGGGAGNDGVSHALLWSGTAASFVDLNPAGYAGSEAHAVSGNLQGGSAFVTDNGPEHAALWSGTADSFVDLNPTNITIQQSRINATQGNQQGGSGNVGSELHALLWSGTADSAVDLHPAGVTSSNILAISATQQVGEADVAPHAALWSGTADSFVDLHPEGYLQSSARGLNAEFQVGVGEFPVFENGELVVSFRHALRWSGSADSVLDLHNFLPDDFTGSTATGIDENGNILGFASIGVSTHAVMWIPQQATPIPLPAPLTPILALGAPAVAFGARIARQRQR